MLKILGPIVSVKILFKINKNIYEKLNLLSLLSIEKDMLNKIKYNNLIDNFTL